MIKENEKGILTLGSKNVNLEKAWEQAVETKESRERVRIRNIRRNIRFIEDKDHASISMEYRPKRGIVKTVDLRENGLRQICDSLGMRSDFVLNSVKFGMPDLAAKALNRYVMREARKGVPNVPDTRDLILQDNELVSCVTERYNDDLGNDEIIKMGMNVEGYHPNMLYQSDGRVTIRYINTDPLDVPEDTSKLFSGFVLSNGTFADRALSIKFCLWRFVCDNGLVMGTRGGNLFRQTHMTPTDVPAFYASLNGVPEIADKVAEQISQAAGHVLTGPELQTYLDASKARAHLQVADMQKLRDELTGGENVPAEDMRLYNGLTRWDVINGITHMAQGYSFDDRMRLEASAGTLLAAA